METVIGWPAASAVSGRTISALRTLVEHGKLAAQKDEQRRRVFAREDLEALREVGPSAEATGEPGGGEPVPAESAPAEPARVEPAQDDLPSAEPAPPELALSEPVLPAPAVVAEDVERAALVFAALDKGASLTAIVVEHHLPPDLVLGLHRKWKELKEVDLNVPSVPAMFERYQKALTTLGERLTALEKSFYELAEHFYNTPLPDRSKYVCPQCGERGHVFLATRCGDCKKESWFGFAKKT